MNEEIFGFGHAKNGRRAKETLASLAKARLKPDIQPNNFRTGCVRFISYR